MVGGHSPLNTMSLPASISKRLRETLGNNTGGDLVTWLDEQRAESAQVRADLAECKTEMLAAMHAMELRLADRIGRVESDLMKWSFVFWVGAVAAIAVLAGILGK